MLRHGRDAGAQLDALAGRVAEGPAIELHHQLVALAEDRGEHRLARQHRGVHREAIDVINIEVLGFG